MEPTYQDGDLVVLRAADTYSSGDIVTFPVPEGTPGAGALVIHRITGGSEAAFTIQGDNNPHVDEWAPGEDDILGAEWFAVPGGGKILRGAMDPALLAAALGGFITMVVLMRPTTAPKDTEATDPEQHAGEPPDPQAEDDVTATTSEAVLHA